MCAHSRADSEEHSLLEEKDPKDTKGCQNFQVAEWEQASLIEVRCNEDVHINLATTALLHPKLGKM